MHLLPLARDHSFMKQGLENHQHEQGNDRKLDI